MSAWYIYEQDINPYAYKPHFMFYFMSILDWECKKCDTVIDFGVDDLFKESRKTRRNKKKLKK